MPQPRVVLLTTGGTIGTSPGYSVRVGGAELLSGIPDELLSADVELDGAGRTSDSGEAQEGWVVR